MGRAYSTQGEKRNTYTSVMGKPEGKIPLGILRRKWEDSIKNGSQRNRMGWFGLDTSWSW
jgi:hypothetical protein